MYRLGHKSRRQRRWPAWVGALSSVTLLALFAFWLALQLVDPDTTITQAKPVTTTIGANNDRKQTITTSEFTMQLPSDWKLIKHLTKPYNLYQYRGGTTTTAQIIEVYVDTVPRTFNVNRVMGVEAAGNRLTLVGSISDNCGDFTNNTSPLTAQGTRAKWRGIDFLCDLSNADRNVVGTSSAGNINSVMMTGETGQKREMFFTYTDYNINPDFQVFFDTLNSFRLK